MSAPAAEEPAVRPSTLTPSARRRIRELVAAAPPISAEVRAQIIRILSAPST